MSTGKPYRPADDRESYPICGSRRVGTYNPGVDMLQSPPPPTGEDQYSFITGQKHYELANHLGNVLAVVSDRKIPVVVSGTSIDHYVVDYTSFQDYYPFGSLMPGRTYTAPNKGYKFGFNGQAKDDEMSGVNGGHLAFKYRIHDARLGRFLSVDPLSDEYTWNSTYAFAENRVIDGVDLEGREYVPYRKMATMRLSVGFYSDQGPYISLGVLRTTGKYSQLASIPYIGTRTYGGAMIKYTFGDPSPDTKSGLVFGFTGGFINHGRGASATNPPQGFKFDEDFPLIVDDYQFHLGGEFTYKRNILHDDKNTLDVHFTFHLSGVSLSGLYGSDYEPSYFRDGEKYYRIGTYRNRLTHIPGFTRPVPYGYKPAGFEVSGGDNLDIDFELMFSSGFLSTGFGNLSGRLQPTSQTSYNYQQSLSADVKISFLQSEKKGLVSHASLSPSFINTGN